MSTLSRNAGGKLKNEQKNIALCFDPCVKLKKVVYTFFHISLYIHPTLVLIFTFLSFKTNCVYDA